MYGRIRHLLHLSELFVFNCSVSLLLVKVKQFTCLSSKATLFYFDETSYMLRQKKKGMTLHYTEMDHFNVRCTCYNI